MFSRCRLWPTWTDRIAEEMKREDIYAAEARHILKKDDDERRRWGLQVFGVDTWNPHALRYGPAHQGHQGG